MSSVWKEIGYDLEIPNDYNALGTACRRLQVLYETTATSFLVDPCESDLHLTLNIIIDFDVSLTSLIMHRVARKRKPMMASKP